MAKSKSGTQAGKSTRARRYAKEPAGKQTPARAKRSDTPEAKLQRARAPKTHPTRTAGAARKDKPTGSAAPSAATPAPASPRVPRKVRRPSRRRRTVA